MKILIACQRCKLVYGCGEYARLWRCDVCPFRYECIRRTSGTDSTITAGLCRECEAKVIEELRIEEQRQSNG